MARPKLREHPYIPDPTLPGPRRGDPYLCRCGLPRRHERHPTNDQQAERAAYDARRIGEREETDVR